MENDMKRRDFIKAVGAFSAAPLVIPENMDRGLLKNHFEAKGPEALADFLNQAFFQVERHDIIVNEVFVSEEDFHYLKEDSKLGNNIIGYSGRRDLVVRGEHFFLWSGNVLPHKDREMKVTGDFRAGSYEITIDEKYIRHYLENKLHPYLCDFEGEWKMKEGYELPKNHKPAPLRAAYFSFKPKNA